MVLTAKHVPVSSFNLVCRTCLLVKDVCSVFEVNYGNINLSEMLKKYTNIEINRNDGMPTNMCQFCIELLVLSYKFLETCNKSNSILVESVANNRDVNLFVDDNINSYKQDFESVTENIILKFVDEEESIGNNYEVDETDQDFFIIESEKQNIQIIEYNNDESYTTQVKEHLIDSNYICSYCQDSFDSSENLQEHIKASNCECCACSIQFQCSALLNHHYNSNNHKYNAVCQICNKSVLDRSKHMVLHSKPEVRQYTRWFCYPCDQIFKTYHTMIRHYKKLHTEENSCIQCCKEFYNIIEHMRSHSNCFKCVWCELRFDTAKDLRTHKLDVNHQKMKSCKICCKVFTDTFSQKTHMRAHTEHREYKCSLCEGTFKYANSLRRHLNRHNGAMHLCPQCGKKFTTKYNLKLHINKHHDPAEKGIGKKKYMCEVCGQICRNWTAYNNHIKNHDGIIYTCSICKTALDSHTEYLKHMDQHKKYICAECGKKFLYFSMYKIHMDKHAGISEEQTSENKNSESPLKCEECGKLFKCKTMLKYHNYQHSGIKPFKCDICSKCFRQPSHLRTHMYQHTGERKYECSYCGKGFIMPSLLTNHIRIHTGERPFVCPICSKAFHDLSGMKKHRRRHMQIKETVETSETDSLLIQENNELIVESD